MVSQGEPYPWLSARYTELDGERPLNLLEWGCAAPVLILLDELALRRSWRRRIRSRGDRRMSGSARLAARKRRGFGLGSGAPDPEIRLRHAEVGLSGLRDSPRACEDGTVRKQLGLGVLLALAIAASAALPASGAVSELASTAVSVELKPDGRGLLTGSRTIVLNGLIPGKGIRLARAGTRDAMTSGRLRAGSIRVATRRTVPPSGSVRLRVSTTEADAKAEVIVRVGATDVALLDVATTGPRLLSEELSVRSTRDNPFGAADATFNIPLETAANLATPVKGWVRTVDGDLARVTLSPKRAGESVLSVKGLDDEEAYTGTLSIAGQQTELSLDVRDLILWPLLVAVLGGVLAGPLPTLLLAWQRRDKARQALRESAEKYWEARREEPETQPVPLGPLEPVPPTGPARWSRRLGLLPTFAKSGETERAGVFGRDLNLGRAWRPSTIDDLIDASDAVVAEVTKWFTARGELLALKDVIERAADIESASELTRHANSLVLRQWDIGDPKLLDDLIRRSVRFRRTLETVIAAHRLQASFDVSLVEPGEAVVNYCERVENTVGLQVMRAAKAGEFAAMLLRRPEIPDTRTPEQVGAAGRPIRLLLTALLALLASAAYLIPVYGDGSFGTYVEYLGVLAAGAAGTLILRLDLVGLDKGDAPPAG